MLPAISRRALLGAALASPGAAAAAALSAAPGVAAAPAPDASALEVTPRELSVSGGQTVVLIGSGLLRTTAVVVVGIPAPDARAVSDHAIVLTSPHSLDYVSAEREITVLAGRDVIASGTASYTAQSPVDRQLQFALAHWSSYASAEYGDFNALGGDCMNFVSQTLVQRGWTMDDRWHNRDGGRDWTRAFIHVPTFEAYLTAERDRLGATRRELADRDLVRIGDIVLFDWDGGGSLDHAQVVSLVEAGEQGAVIRMAGHNIDSPYRDLDRTITVDHPGATARFWSLA